VRPFLSPSPHPRKRQERPKKPGPTVCFAFDSAGELLASTNPAGGASTWKPLSGAVPNVQDVSCPSRSLCVAIDQAGRLFTSRHPSATGRPWTLDPGATLPSPFSDPQPGASISCSSVSLCVASIVGEQQGGTLRFPVTNYRLVVATTNPMADPVKWRRVFSVVTVDEPPATVTCPTALLCVAFGVQDDGTFLISTNPKGGPHAWYQDLPSFVSNGIGTDPPDGIACPSPSLCIAVNDLGVIIRVRREER
jgi:hypothetical protein